MNSPAPLPSPPRQVSTTTATGLGAGVGVLGVLVYEQLTGKQLDAISAASVSGVFATAANYWWHVATTIINRKFNINSEE